MNFILFTLVVAMMLLLLSSVHAYPPYYFYGSRDSSYFEKEKKMTCNEGEEYNTEYKKCFPPGICKERENLIQRIGYSIGESARCKESDAMFWIGLGWGWITALLSFIVGTCIMRSRENDMYKRIPPRVYIPCEHLMNARFKVRPNSIIPNLHEERKKKLAAEAALANKERALVPYSPPPIIFEGKEDEESSVGYVGGERERIPECWKDECIKKAKAQKM